MSHSLTFRSSFLWPKFLEICGRTDGNFSFSCNKGHKRKGVEESFQHREPWYRIRANAPLVQEVNIFFNRPCHRTVVIIAPRYGIMLARL